MSEGNLFYQEFMSVIRRKVPHRATLANAITDLLDIDKDAVYRRLRGEVNFTFTEMALIARNMGISLDSIARIENKQSRPCQMNISRQVNPTAIDYEMFEGHVNLLKSIKDDPETLLHDAGNIFAHYLYQDYEYLTRFHLFRWNRASGFGDSRPFHEITIPERLRTLQIETCQYARHIKLSYFTFDSFIFQRLVTKIKFFAQIRLIKEEDVCLIKSDLMTFLHNLEKLAEKGKYEDTGNEVHLMISDISADSNYSCLKTRNIKLTLFRTFLLNAIVSFDEVVYHETIAWIHSLQKMSSLISFSGERLRTAFFDSQRKIIDTL